MLIITIITTFINQLNGLCVTGLYALRGMGRNCQYIEGIALGEGLFHIDCHITEEASRKSSITDVSASEIASRALPSIASLNITAW